ncbi:subfamily B ATP-binding cassette protein MsbA [Thiogranum longum]|uniref:Subfamily B ATP-binding cassette protein MsbA n=1 Tax=Thiogranum longum TaxID=1537524 RepID=A0A4R1H933_9GAMM|nr:lipid A export permease/ATP-binding protein MsbA [Thiogranum longum]TCK18367.1 subfamily B ATP-binding cassette protein MsbA [Thiogranum longum]
MAESEPVAVSVTGPYRRLLTYARPHWRIFAGAVVAMVLVAATETGFAALMKPMLDGNFIERDPATIRLVPIALILLFLFRGLAGFASRYGMALISRRVISQLREELFHKFLRLPASYYDRNTAGRLLSRLTFDVEQVAEASTNAVTILIRDSLTLLFLLGYMFWISGWLTLLFLLVGPVLVLLIRYVSRRFRRISKRIQDSMGELTQFSDEAIHGHRLIKTFNAERWQESRFRGVNERNRKLHLRMAAVAGASTPVIQFIAACILALVVYLTTLESVASEISVGSFVSFIAAMMLLMQPMKRLTNINASVQRGVAAARSIFAVLDEENEDPGGNARLSRVRGAIEFRDVSFAYDEHKGNVIEHLSFLIEPGQRVALVGHSGSGKSTLAQLLVRFHDPVSGSVLLDGRDLRDYRRADLRSQIGMVGQEVILFNDTIRNNIAFGSLADASEQEIIAAAESAHAMDFINELPQGLDTRIGDRGALLSGGQRQRLAIARTILKDAPILVMDEATSALDSVSERLVHDALEQLMQKRTSLVIAHRLSTVEHADRILVLEKGALAESGTHSELLAKRGVYADLYRLQFSDSRLT